jgi:glycosyl transferase/beta-hydroxylase protein BlmF
VIRFIATKHPEYAEGFPGDTVIDPWRYVTDARRLGENKPELISLLVPTRGRVWGFSEMVLTAWETATFPNRVEVVSYHDEDDRTDRFRRPKGNNGPTYSWTGLTGPRILLSEAWNECAKVASGSILMHCGDDIVFRTPGWDSIVRKAFAQSEDKLILVHGDDCSPNTDVLATHGFLHRRWVETVGYFLPPYFSCDWNDVWLTEVADMIGRRVKVPIVTEHMHYSFDKRPHDQTDAEREQRGRDDDVVKLYESLEKERKSDALKLKAAIA